MVRVPLSRGRGKTRRVGSEDATDKLSEQLNCSGVKPGRLEVQGLRKGVLASRAAERSMLSGLDILLAPWAEPRFWAVPVGAAQEVGGRQLHLEEARGCTTREGEYGREL